MYINQVNANPMARTNPVSITNYNDSEQGLLLAPNFMFVNKPTTSDKQTFYKLIVWFELIANNNQVDWSKLPRNISLTNLCFTLFKREQRGIISIDYAAKQKSAVLDQLILTYDVNNNRIKINHHDFLEYKIPSELIDQDNNDFLFRLDYQSTSKIGLTNNYGVGFNKGLLNIKTATETIGSDKFVFNQVMACLSRDSLTNKENVFYPLIRKTISLKANLVQTRMRNGASFLKLIIHDLNVKPIFIQDIDYLKNILWDIHNSLVNDEIVVEKLKIVGNNKLKDYYNFEDVNCTLNEQQALVFNDHFGYDYDNGMIVKQQSGDLLFSTEIQQHLHLVLDLFGKAFDYQIPIQNDEPALNYFYNHLSLTKFITYKPSYFTSQTTGLKYETFKTKWLKLFDEQTKTNR